MIFVVYYLLGVIVAFVGAFLLNRTENERYYSELEDILKYMWLSWFLIFLIVCFYIVEKMDNLSTSDKFRNFFEGKGIKK